MNDYIKTLVDADKLNISLEPGRWQFDSKPYIISGPCSIESNGMIIDWAVKMKELGVDALRGGAYKPCTYPITKEVNGWKEGMQKEGLSALIDVKIKTGMTVVSEIMDASQINEFSMEAIDIIQVGTRNFQNYTLLDALGKLDKPILLKRGTWGTIDEILGACERIMVGGNEVTINKVDKILNVMGSVKRAGPLGSGHAMKSLNNYVSAAGLIASFEALNTAKKYGIESKDFIAIINGATGKNNTTEVKLEKFVVSEKYNSGFALDLMIKDVSIADQLIKKMSSDNPLSKQVLEYLEKSYKIVGKNSDHTEVFKVLKN